MAIGVEEAPQKALEFQRRHGLTFPVVSDPHRQVFAHFFLPFNYNLPYMVLIGRDGRIHQVDCDLKSLPQAIEQLTASEAAGRVSPAALGGGAWPADTGIGIPGGLPIGAATVRLLRRFLYGLSPFDPIAFAAASLAGTVIAMLASWHPARRVTRVDPITALKYE